MSPTDPSTGPIAPDSPLGCALGSGTVPELPADFADRVIARVQDRPAPLPQLRSGGGTAGRWRNMRRLGVGLAVSGALATAAAATGLLGGLPSPREMWSAITGQESEPVVAPAPIAPKKSEDAVPEKGAGAEQRVKIEGPIDTPEELEEAFRRVDQRREGRRENRDAIIDQRIDRAIERRREQGLPGPAPEREAQIRQRAKQIGDNAETRADQRIEARRESLRERVETGEEIVPEEFLRQRRPGQSESQIRQQIEELRKLPPAQRRERMRQLRQQWREGQQATPAPAPTQP